MRYLRTTLLTFLFILSSYTKKASAIEQLNDYSIFRVRQLDPGKEVTVGRYVMSYMTPADRIKVLGASPPQWLDIRLQWLDSAPSASQKQLSWRWIAEDRKLMIGVRSQAQSLSESAYFSDSEDRDELMLVRDQKEQRMSLPLNKMDYLHLFPDPSLRSLEGKVRIVVSSNRAYQIFR